MSRPDRNRQAPALCVLMTPGSARKFFSALAATRPGSRKLYSIPIALRGFRESAGVVDRVYQTFLDTAPRRDWHRWLPRPWVKAILHLKYNGMRQWFSLRPTVTAVCWSGLDRNRLLFSEAARHAGNRVLFAELAPLPGFLTLDPAGVNAANSVPRDPEFFRQWATAHPPAIDWRKIGSTMVARKPRSAAQSGRDPSVLPADAGPFVFVPLQVPGDSQLRYYGDWIQSLEHLIEVAIAAAKRLPDGWHIRIKEHPSARIRVGHLVTQAAGARCVLDNETDTFELVRRSGAVLTINSSVGLQSFFFDKPVIVLGQAFFGFEPLVYRARSLDQLESLFAQVTDLTVDHDLRADFMRYLQEHYYLPHTLRTTGGLSEAAQAHVTRLLTTEAPAVEHTRPGNAGNPSA